MQDVDGAGGDDGSRAPGGGGGRRGQKGAAPQLKTRKPYTMTKQRERWTDEEHQRFVEALRVHGRQWRKIEEAVKTKTSVQIRSHAQKFFSKIEKQQKQLQAGMAPPANPEIPVDLQIPPPRPKRRSAQPTRASSADLGPANIGALAALPDYAAAVRGGAGAGYGSHHTIADITVAAVTAAASAAAAAAAAAVVAAAGREIEARLQSQPPDVFPFCGLTPAMLRAMSNPMAIHANIQASIAAASGPPAPPVPSGVPGPVRDIGAERTGTSEPGYQIHPPRVHGEDGEDSACSREDEAKQAGGSGGEDAEGGVNPAQLAQGLHPTNSGGSTLARLLAPSSWQAPAPPLSATGLLPPSSVWAPQFSDPLSMAAQLWANQPGSLQNDLKFGDGNGGNGGGGNGNGSGGNGSGGDKQPTVNNLPPKPAAQAKSQPGSVSGGGFKLQPADADADATAAAQGAAAPAQQQHPAILAVAGEKQKRPKGAERGSKTQPSDGGSGGSSGQEGVVQQGAGATKPRAALRRPDGEASGSNPTGNGSSLNGSVHPFNGNGHGHGHGHGNGNGNGTSSKLHLPAPPPRAPAAPAAGAVAAAAAPPPPLPAVKSNSPNGDNGSGGNGNGSGGNGNGSGGNGSGNLPAAGTGNGSSGRGSNAMAKNGSNGNGSGGNGSGGHGSGAAITTAAALAAPPPKPAHAHGHHAHRGVQVGGVAKHHHHHHHHGGGNGAGGGAAGKRAHLPMRQSVNAAGLPNASENGVAMGSTAHFGSGPAAPGPPPGLPPPPPRNGNGNGAGNGDKSSGGSGDKSSGGGGEKGSGGGGDGSGNQERSGDRDGSGGNGSGGNHSTADGAMGTSRRMETNVTEAPAGTNGGSGGGGGSGEGPQPAAAPPPAADPAAPQPAAQQAREATKPAAAAATGPAAGPAAAPPAEAPSAPEDTNAALQTALQALQSAGMHHLIMQQAMTAGQAAAGFHAAGGWASMSVEAYSAFQQLAASMGVALQATEVPLPMRQDAPAAPPTAVAPSSHLTGQKREREGPKRDVPRPPKSSAPSGSAGTGSGGTGSGPTSSRKRGSPRPSGGGRKKARPVPSDDL